MAALEHHPLNPMLVYDVIDLRSSPDHPLGDAVETFIRREDAERFIEEVRGDEPELATPLSLFARMPIEITQATLDRLSVLANVCGRAFVTEPMMCWPLGESEDIEARLVRAFEYFLERLIELGMVWETGPGIGAAVWIPPDQLPAWKEAQRQDARVYSLTEDDGRRWDAFWEWVESKIPDEPLWYLDSVAVLPDFQGGGIGSRLIEFGLARARADGVGMHLETGSARNVPLYERFGFRVIEDADAPAGGPHVWFMRWDP